MTWHEHEEAQPAVKGEGAKDGGGGHSQGMVIDRGISISSLGAAGKEKDGFD